MADKHIQLTNILDRYIEEVDSEPTALDDVVDWALTLGLFRPEPRDIRKIFKEALAESLRQEKRFDGKRWYRAKRSVRTNIGGVQLNLWADGRQKCIAWVYGKVSRSKSARNGQ
jgi:hypothetical protein